VLFDVQGEREAVGASVVLTGDLLLIVPKVPSSLLVFISLLVQFEKTLSFAYARLQQREVA